MSIKTQAVSDIKGCQRLTVLFRDDERRRPVMSILMHLVDTMCHTANASASKFQMWAPLSKNQTFGFGIHKVTSGG